VSTDGS